MTFNVSMEVNKPYLKAFRDKIQKLARILFTENEWVDFTVNLDSLNCALKGNLNSFLASERKNRDSGSSRGRGRGSYRGRGGGYNGYFGGPPTDNRFSYSGGYGRKRFDPDVKCDRCFRVV